jgi:hypothetical protein
MNGFKAHAKESLVISRGSDRLGYEKYRLEWDFLKAKWIKKTKETSNESGGFD